MSSLWTFDCTVRETFVILLNIHITNGAAGALFTVFKILNVNKIGYQICTGGAYMNILKVNNAKYGFYTSFESIIKNIKLYSNCAALICNTNNPTGIKYGDKKIIELIKLLDKNNIIIILDSPYRKLYTDSNGVAPC